MKHLVAKIREFNDEREWHKYHDPKSITLALCSEVGELADIFCWMQSTRKLSDVKMEKVRSEIAYIFIYLATLSYELGIDLEKTVMEKLAKNEKRFPPKHSR